MRPLRLSIEGFGSYLDPVDVNLSDVRQGVIVGHNGAGKSTFLSAITFALYGRSLVDRDANSVLNAQATQATVQYEFATADDTRWRVTRTRTTSRTTATLETADETTESGWRAVSTGQVRDTDNQIVTLLGASWETFAASVFCGQGDGSRFTDAAPADRKAILAEILGLERFAAAATQAKKHVTDTRSETDRITTQIRELTDLANRLPEFTTQQETSNTHLTELQTQQVQARVELRDATDAVTQAAQHVTQTEHELTSAQQAALSNQTRIGQLQSEHENLTGTLATLKHELTSAQQAENAAQKLTETILTDTETLTSLQSELETLTETGQTTATQTAQLETEHENLTGRSQEITERLETLTRPNQTHETTCFTCGQNLAEELRTELVKQLETEHENLTGTLNSLQTRITELNTTLETLRTEHKTLKRRFASTETFLQTSIEQRDKKILTAARIPDLQTRITELNGTLNSLQSELETLTETSSTQTITTLSTKHTQAQTALTQTQAKHTQAQTKLAQLDEQLTTAWRNNATINERLETAQQASQRINTLTSELSTAQHVTETWNTLSQAFGRDGIPALVLAGTIPELETQINDVLERLSHGTLLVELHTTRENKSGTVTDTLDIKVIDITGTTRPYESFSGGERTRLDRAIRIGLGRLIARRSGAAINTLVIDEGWGTLDPDGIINAVDSLRLLTDEFDCVLTVTHLETVAEAFPTIIRVTRPGDTSTINITQTGIGT